MLKRFISRISRRYRLLLGAAALCALLPAAMAVQPLCQVEQARQTYGVEIVTEGQTWDDVSLNTVLDALGRLPPYVVKQLGSRSYGRLYILSNAESRSLSGARVYSSGANFYSNNDGRNELVLYPDQGTKTVLHELGHAYQLRMTPAGRYAWVFFQQEMRDFMEATGWKLLSSDEEVAAAVDQTQIKFEYDGPQVWQFMSNNDPLEDYANSFALYFYDPQQLQQLSPVRYQWMAANVGTDSR
jgi:hypothetical protein